MAEIEAVGSRITRCSAGKRVKWLAITPLTPPLGSILLLVLVILGGCGPSDEQLRQRQRDSRMVQYRSDLSLPLAEIQTYSGYYAEHQAKCNTATHLGRYHCESAKGDLARLQNAQRQALTVYQRIAADPLMSETDHQDARQNIAVLTGPPSQ
jgi:hypothetical protein